MDQFDKLRREAFYRGMRDYERAQETANQDGSPIFKNNPHQNNHATDEKESWEEGWESARSECEDPGQYVTQADKNMGWPFPVVHGEIPNGSS